MAEGIPNIPNGAESFSPDNDREAKRKKRKRRSGAGGLGAIASGSSENAATQEQTKRERQPKPIKGLFELAEEAGETKEKSADPEASQGENVERVEADTTTVTPEQESAEANTELIASRELTPDEFNGGEVVINLRSRTGSEATPGEESLVTERPGEPGEQPELAPSYEEELLPEATAVEDAPDDDLDVLSEPSQETAPTAEHQIDSPEEDDDTEQSPSKQTATTPSSPASSERWKFGRWW